MGEINETSLCCYFLLFGTSAASSEKNLENAPASIIGYNRFLIPHSDEEFTRLEIIVVKQVENSCDVMLDTGEFTLRRMSDFGDGYLTFDLKQNGIGKIIKCFGDQREQESGFVEVGSTFQLFQSKEPTVVFAPLGQRSGIDTGNRAPIQ